jgi:transcriptional antiterminator RfaH
MPWYVVLTKPRQELRCQEQLQEQGGEVFLPMLEVEKLQRGKKIKKWEPLFPGYLFLQIACDNALLGKVRSTLGARQLLSFVNTPVTVNECLITDIKNRCAQQITPELFQIGQKVRMLDGPFKDYEALFHKYDGTERAVILLTLLNQQNELVVELAQLCTQNA